MIKIILTTLGIFCLIFLFNFSEEDVKNRQLATKQAIWDYYNLKTEHYRSRYKKHKKKRIRTTISIRCTEAERNDPLKQDSINTIFKQNPITE